MKEVKLFSFMLKDYGISDLNMEPGNFLNLKIKF